MLFLSCRSNNLSFFLQKNQKFAPFRAAFKHNSFSHFSFLLWHALYFAIIFCKYGMYFWFTLHPPPPPKGVHPREGGGNPQTFLMPRRSSPISHCEFAFAFKWRSASRHPLLLVFKVWLSLLLVLGFRWNLRLGALQQPYLPLPAASCSRSRAAPDHQSLQIISEEKGRNYFKSRELS